MVSSPALILLTAFQLISMAQVVFNDDGSLSTGVSHILRAYLAVEWVYFIAMSIARKRADPALEMVAFFLTGIGLVTVAGANKDLVKTQFVADMLGIFCFVLSALAHLECHDRAIVCERSPMAGGNRSAGLTLILARNIKGAFNWLSIGGMSISLQSSSRSRSSFVGAATLDKYRQLVRSQNILSSASSVVALLFLMRDLGAALIFFFTFIVLAFMRSGDFRTISAPVRRRGDGGGLVVLIRSDFVMARFATHRHVWDDMYGKGYQQTRVLIYSVSGGLLGVGIGDGKLKEVPAATEDLVFGMICEEWGIIMGILVILCIMFIAFHSIRCASGSRSAFAMLYPA